MKELILSKDGKTTMTSLELLEQINLFRAEIEGKTELAHRSLLGIIRDEFEEEINAQKLLPVEYTDKKGEKRPMFELTFSQAKQVLMRESKSVRRAVIDYIEKLEKAFSERQPQTHTDEHEKAFDVPQTFAEALRLAAEQAELIEAQTKQLEEQKPKVDFADKLLKSKDSILIREFAKIMWEEGVCQFGEKKMFACLRNNGYLMKGNEPYQKYIHLFEVQERPIDTAFGVKITTTTKITPHGQLYFYNKLKELESNFQITTYTLGGNI